MIRELAFSGEIIVLSLFGLVMITLTMVVVFKYHFKQSVKEMTQKYLHKKSKSPLETRTKYAEIDGFSYSKTFLLWGLVVATTSALLAINWTVQDFHPNLETQELVYVDDFTESIRTADQPAPKLPPPPVVKIVEIPLEEFIEDQPTFVDNFLTPTERVIEEKPVAKSVPPPPLPPPIAEDNLLLFVEQMPRFPGCEHLKVSKAEKESCSTSKLLKYINDHVEFPALAREVGMDGMVVVQFVVGKEGLIEDIKVMREPGGGLGEAVVKAVESMNKMSQKWTPGRQQGRSVKVQYTLPIRFKLQ